MAFPRFPVSDKPVSQDLGPLACTVGKFIVPMVGEAYDAQARNLNRKLRVDCYQVRNHMGTKFKRIETKLIHAGEPEPRIRGAVVMPVFQSAMFEYAGEASYHDLKYIRLNNTPNHVALHQKLAAVENAQAALVTASGMAAISTSLLTVLKAGDHLLIQSALYGGTHDLMTRDFPAFGFSYDFIEADRPETWKALLKPNTKAIYVEAMTNPLLQVADLEAVVQFARTHGLVSLIDSTFASPVNFRALDWGFDLSLHSGTKYLNGHSDIACGVVLGQAERIQKITH